MSRKRSTDELVTDSSDKGTLMIEHHFTAGPCPSLSGRVGYNPAVVHSAAAAGKRPRKKAPGLSAGALCALRRSDGRKGSSPA